MFNRVDFPDPDAPRTTTNSPGAMRRETFLRASTLPLSPRTNVFEMASASIIEPPSRCRPRLRVVLTGSRQENLLARRNAALDLHHVPVLIAHGYRLSLWPRFAGDVNKTLLPIPLYGRSGHQQRLVLRSLNRDIRRHVRLQQLGILTNIDHDLVVDDSGNDSCFRSDTRHGAGEISGGKRIHSEADGITGLNIGNVGLIHHGNQLQRVVCDDRDERRSRKRCCDCFAFLSRYRSDNAADGRPDLHIREVHIHQITVAYRFLILRLRFLQRELKVLLLLSGNEALRYELLGAVVPCPRAFQAGSVELRLRIDVSEPRQKGGIVNFSDHLTCRYV